MNRQDKQKIIDARNRMVVTKRKTGQEEVIKGKEGQIYADRDLNLVVGTQYNMQMTYYTVEL